MLETKIENLTKEVENLRATMLVLIQALQAKPSIVQPAVEDEHKIPFDDEEVKASIKEGKTKVEKIENSETITRDELQSLCAKIVRDDASKRDAVKNTIQAFGGSNLTKVDESKYSELKAALEAL